MRVIRHLDLVVLVLALPVFLLGDLSMAGYLAGAGAWVVQRAISAYATRRAETAPDPRATVGIMAGSMIGRGWLVALTIFGIGRASGDNAGLAAAVLVIALFTVYFTVRMILRPFDIADEKAKAAAGGTP